jgi:formylglycine-generating enzyme required for sulfatase activity
MYGVHTIHTIKKQPTVHCEGAGSSSPPTVWISIFGMEFVLIQAGVFIMGDRELQDAKPHEVSITHPFLMGRYPVTQEEWIRVMGENPSSISGQCQPVNNVSWNQCINFIERLNIRERKEGSRYRLPSETEWEYACRAGTRERFYFGNDEHELIRFGWFRENSHDRTHPVGQFSPNPWGLQDMYGNVAEWCQDSYQVYSISKNTDPFGPDAKVGDRVNRGGCWASRAERCASSYRMCDDPDEPGPYLGLRLVREL